MNKMDRRTIIEWEKEFDTRVMDADGFPKGTDRDKTLFTKDEFLSNCTLSTIMLGDKMREALKNTW